MMIAEILGDLIDVLHDRRGGNFFSKQVKPVGRAAIDIEFWIISFEAITGVL